MGFSARKIVQLVNTEKASAKKMLTITQLAIKLYIKITIGKYFSEETR